MTSSRGKLGVSQRYKEKVKKIAEREALVDRMNVMKNVLMQKVCMLSNEPLSKTMMANVVQDFLNDEAHHFELREKTRIDKYAKILSKRIQRKHADGQVVNKQPKQNLHQVPQSKENTEEAKIEPSIDDPKKELHPKLKDLRHPEADPWALMNIINTIDMEENQVKAHRTAVSRQKMMASNLQKQLEERKAIAKAEAEERNRYVEEQKKKISEWQKEEKLCEISEKEKSAQLGTERQEQIEKRKIQREREAKELRDAELERVEKIKQELLEDEKLRVVKIMEERKRLEGVKLENVKNEEIRRKKREDEAKLDAKLMREYKERVDREEQARVDAFNARLARYEKIALQREEAGFNKLERERILRVEQKILREALAKEKADIEREKRDKRTKKQKQIKIGEDNRKMLEDKAYAKRLEEEADEKFIIQYKKDIEQMLNEEKSKQQKRKDLDRNHCARLVDQIKTRANSQEQHMTNTERSMNKEIIDRIENDPGLRQKLSDKLTELDKKRTRPSIGLDDEKESVFA